MNILLKTEILVLFISLIYIVFYIFDKILFTFNKVKKIVKPQIIKNDENKVKIITDKSIVKAQKKEKNKKRISEEEKEKLKKLLKRIDINITKGYFDTSKNLIVEGLAIDKFNKDLNLKLVKIYELEKNYKKAEYVYHDMINHMWSKFILLSGLGKIYLKQWNLKKAIKFYKKALTKKSNNIEIIEKLSDLYFDTKQYDNSLKYTINFLKEHPRNPEKLGIKWYCLEKDWKIKEAIIEYNKVLDLQPYNSEIIDRIKKLKKKFKK